MAATVQDAPKDLAVMADSRARLYLLISKALLPPGEELAEMLRSGEAAEVMAAALEVCPHLSCMESCGAPSADFLACPPDIAALRLEHTRLFADPRQLLVPCYESMYLDSSGLVMGRPAQQVRRAYAAEGLGLAERFHDLPDHLAVEMEFMAYLCSREGSAWIEADAANAARWAQKEAAFLHDHLLRWLPAFRDRLSRETRLPFYNDVSLLAHVLALSDYQMALALAGRRQGSRAEHNV